MLAERLHHFSNTLVPHLSPEIESYLAAIAAMHSAGYFGYKSDEKPIIIDIYGKDIARIRLLWGSSQGKYLEKSYFMEEASSGNPHIIFEGFFFDDGKDW